MSTSNYCSTCGAQHAALAKFCESCGAPRGGAATGSTIGPKLLSETEIREIAIAVDSMDVDGTLELSLSMFKFVQAWWADEGKDVLHFEVTNPDNKPVEEELGKQGWQVFDPGEGYDKSFEQDFECPDVESRARAIRRALDALLLTAGDLAEFKKITFGRPVDGVFEKQNYRIAK